MFYLSFTSLVHFGQPSIFNSGYAYRHSVTAVKIEPPVVPTCHFRQRSAHW